MKTALLILLGAVLIQAQDPAITPICQQTNCYTASTGNVSLSGAGTAATIQQPAAAPFQLVSGIKATVYCSVACIVTRSKDGTAASTTAAQSSIVQSPAQPNGRITPLMLFFTASNATGGTTIDVTNVNAGITYPFDLSDVTFGTNPQQTYTISVASITGTANITYYVGLK